MDVVLTHPSFWPYVRRGAEREVHDLGARLVAAGHGVRLLTGMPEGLTRRTVDDGIDVRYLRVPHLPSVTSEAVFAAVALPVLPFLGGDLVHAFHYADAWAALQARRRPVVLKLTGTVRPERMAGVRFDRRLFREAVERADAVWCNSTFARDEMAGFGRAMDVVPAGVDLDRFTPGEATAPIVLCTAAPDDPRKRLVDVLDAWPSVLDEVPDARLRIAGREVPELLARLPASARPSVELTGVLGDVALVDAYRSAAATVAPALHEALGLATLESLACGTPVAGADSGATTELLPEGTGATFAPTDADACAKAIVVALDLAQDPATAGRCRAAAEPYGWDRVVTDVLARYGALLQGRSA
ncbi:MAG: GDP-mannose-dependent alpha-(1-6)-phosphatidylinositol dimannoside mannosyltransferase [Actinomycetia bacterium]|nr:GDP-mannose-dependent alpha-(1-6)-phosphatidylinositol dimannoside mannosyltransferase [Actinomycetes bacterium]